MQKYPDQPAVPSKLVDLVWHEHILDTQEYKRDTLRMFGHYVHHAPSFGGEEEKKELITQQSDMLKSYRRIFEASPGPIWQQPRAGVGEFRGDAGDDAGDMAEQKSPDCCSAKCVKPNCQSCVGCNRRDPALTLTLNHGSTYNHNPFTFRLDCGYMADAAVENDGTGGLMKLETSLSPTRFGGYVPTPHPMQANSEPQYLCSVTPTAGNANNLSWSISGNQIYFKHTLEAAKGWYGIGLGKTSNMEYADYNIVFPSGNFTGVRDLYKWDAGNGYPCWDIEYECSGKQKNSAL